MQKLSELDTVKLNRESLFKAEQLCEELAKLNLLPSEYFVCDDNILLLWTKKNSERKSTLDLLVGEHFRFTYIESDLTGVLYSQYKDSTDPVADIERFWK